MSERLEFSPEESSTLEEGGVVTKLTAMGWAAFYVTKGVGRHACTSVFGDTEEKAREAAARIREPWHGIRADGPHFH